MLLAMELFLLVRHTHPPLRMEMEDIHTHTKAHWSTGKRRCTHVHTLTLMENYSQGEFKHMGGYRFTDDGSVEITESWITWTQTISPKVFSGCLRRRKHKSLNIHFVYYVSFNIRMNVGGMLQIETFSAHRFDLEALNHPVQKRPRPSVKSESASTCFYFITIHHLQCRATHKNSSIENNVTESRPLHYLVSSQVASLQCLQLFS